MNTSVHGKDIHFDSHYLSVELDDGRIISTPLDWYPELVNADEAARSDWQFICRGTGIEWPTLDYHLSIESMLVGHHLSHKPAAAS